MMDSRISRRRALAAMLGYPATVAIGRCLQAAAPPPVRSRSVIVSSDDAGMCAAVNAGTIHALEQGILSSVSIMSCCPAFDEFAEFAVAHPEFDYGVHLVLTCDLREQPWGAVSSDGVHTLVDDRGMFREWPSADLDVAEAEAELRAQIDKAIGAGIQITHLDHHMWVMFDSLDLLRLYVKLGRDYRLPIRFSRIAPRQIRQRGPDFVRVYLEQADNLTFRGFPVLAFVESDNYSIRPADKRDFFIRHCHDLPPGIGEYVIHCALPAGRTIPPDFTARQADTRFWTSEEAAECLREHSIERTSWKAVMSSERLFTASQTADAYSTR